MKKTNVLKRSFAVLLSVLLLLSVAPVAGMSDLFPKVDFGMARAADVVASGTCGETSKNVTWTLDADGTLTFEGYGEIVTYLSTKWPWDEYKAQIKHVVFGANILGISNSIQSYGNQSVSPISLGAFADCTALETVTTTGDFVHFDSWTFRGCTSLRSVRMSDSAYSEDLYYWNVEKDVGSEAFSGCTSLETVELSPRIESIDSHAFENCTSLESIVLPENLITIGSSSFSGCTGLTSIRIPDKVKSIGKGAFTDCAELSTIQWGSALKKIGMSAFRDCDQLQEVVIPEGVIYVGRWAFSHCDMLKKLTIASTVETLFYGEYDTTSYGNSQTIDNCPNLEEVVLLTNSYTPEFLANRIHHCPKLKRIVGTNSDYLMTSGRFVSEESMAPKSYQSNEEFEEGMNASYRFYWELEYAADEANWEGNVLYKDDILLKVNPNISGSFTVKAGTKEINRNAFMNCGNLTSVTLPDSVEWIQADAFRNCTLLSSVHLSAGLKKISTNAFYNCSQLAEIAIPESVKDIGNQAFYGCSSLNRASLPGAACIGRDVFLGTGLYNNAENWIDGMLIVGTTIIDTNDNLPSEVVIPQETTSIACDAFDKTIDKLTLNNRLKVLGYRAFDFSRITEVVCDADWSQNLEYIDSYALSYSPFEELTFGESLESIGNSAFAYSRNLKKVVFNNSPAPLDQNYVFEDCSALTEVRFSDACPIVNLSAFRNCRSLMTLDIPCDVIDQKSSWDWVPSLWSAGCTLKTIHIDGDWTYLNDHGLMTISTNTEYYGSNALESFEITGKLPVLKYLFYGCSNLTTFSAGGICDGTINEYAFYGCEKLKNISIGSDISAIGESAFCGCSSLENVPFMNHVKKIGIGAFANCNALKEVQLPDCLETIGGGAFAMSGIERIRIPANARFTMGIAYASMDCKEFVVDENNPYLSAKDGVLYNKDQTVLLEYPCGKDGDYFVVPDGVRSLPVFAFSKTFYLDENAPADSFIIRIPFSVRFIEIFTDFSKGLHLYYCGNETQWREICTGTYLAYSMDDPMTVGGAELSFDTFFNGSSEESGYEKIPVSLEKHEWTPWRDTEDGSQHIRNCQYCTATETDIHAWNNGVVTKEATCKEQGSKLYTCTVCGATKTEPIAINPENHADYGTHLENAADATCLEKGYTGDTVCNGCGATLTAGEDTDPLGHDWGDWTDNGDGNHSRICKRDDSHIETAVHVWNGGVVTKEATCKEQGNKLYTCTVCGATKTEPIAINPENHADYGTHTENVADATCLEKGYTGDTVCNGCGATLTAGEDTDPLGHDWGDWTDNGDGNHIRICKRDDSHIETAVHVWNGGVVIKEATCKEQGSKLYTCTVCGATKTEPIAINPENHADYGTHTENAADATCLEKGYTGDTVCNGCGATLTAGEDIDPLGHDWGDWTDNGDGNHIRICKRDDSHIETAVHVWNGGVVTKEATCKEQGSKLYTCTVCGATKTEPIAINPENHADYGTHTENAADATCLEKGYTGDTVCNGCGATLTAGEDIDPLGHDWGDWTETKAATENECGEETRICKRNASHRETRPTPVLTPDSKNNESIQTEKTATYDAATGEATISLSAESKGQTIRTKTTTPLDIVLVLDQSGSMGYQMNSDTRPSDISKNRKAKLKDAVNAFVAKMAQDNSDHRISIVGFAMGNTSGKSTDEYGRTRSLSAYDNTNILTVPNGASVKFDPTPSSIPTMNDAYRQSLVSVAVNGGINPVITNAINSIDACGATAADLGLLMACKVFEQNADADGRKRVVVFMTDGEPTYSSTFSDTVANYARSNAALLKNAYGAEIYSVGVIGTGISQKCEQFLKDVASGADNYYRVTNAEALMNSFNDIAVESVKVETAFDDVTLVDTVTKEFTLTQTQEQTLRLSAVETLGVEDKDIAIDRLEDGTTQIRIAHIHPKMEQRGEDTYFTIDFSFAVSANENALDNAAYATNTDNAGVKIGEGTVFEQQFRPASVTVEAAEGVVCFHLNGTPFHMVRFHAGDRVTAPTLTLEGTHTFSGWTIPAPLTFTNGKIELEAALTQPQYSVTWIIDGAQTVEHYQEGEILAVPQVGLSSDGKVFSGWTPAVPNVMPARDLTFTAQYAAHTHRYEEQIVKTASCGVAGIKRYACACGASYDETIPALSHTWTTFATEAATGQGNFSYIVCANCGATQKMSFSYQVEASNRKTQPYDLSLRDLNNALVQPTDGEITITLPIPSEMRYAKDVKVYRIEADGSKTDMGANKLGWDSVRFTTDHFSPYILEAVYACETTGNHAWNDGEVTKNATCSAQGEKTFVCTDCGATKSETIPVNANAHSLTFVPEKKATTEAEGNIAHYRCAGCGKNFSDASGKNELMNVTTDKLPKQDEPQRDPNACKWCGKVHNGFFQKIIGFFHSILAAILGAKY